MVDDILHYPSMACTSASYNYTLNNIWISFGANNSLWKIHRSVRACNQFGLGLPFPAF